ncbi:MAG: hypothetical protein A3F47_01605 [Candidatus Staskawiczbacteria bacterium RIFCSPHIGHO2_12_FULL_38_11]|uniref:Uncharacterized protein n=1 Tax=Candidatus Staskawiczbacteria bacterium RIFCSPHIGHO2_12_FULL_38_11 TaxID=1802209 RepID=A0A1G2I5Y8_9BACT|nr:MAG: hypothetical protein A3F47_01605 [Candidatus Staskawiczbacteria bacterium RIFCSPHIGHO2_12_FULL_38_11]
MGIITIFLLAVLFGIFITLVFEFILKTNKSLRKKYYQNHKVFWGYHVHHSTYGLLLIIVSIILFILDKNFHALNSTGIGIGIIIMHTLSDGRFVFIEKEKKGHHLK